MLKAQALGGLAEPYGLGGIQLTNALVEVDVAVRAGASAARAHDQKSGRTAGEAFPDVGATGLLADRVQVQVQQQIGNGSDALPLRGFDAQPLGLEHG